MPERDDIGLIRGQVRSINESRYLRRAPQLRQMLSYVVERSLENRESELKQYSLGVEGFQRPADFDPRVDPIVRVRARNLRSRLERYYANEGAGDKTIIEIPAGSYIPRISFRSPRNAAGNQRPVRTLPRIAGSRIRVSARLIKVSDRNADWLHKQWREDHTEDFALDDLPPYSPELNPIERV